MEILTHIDVVLREMDLKDENVNQSLTAWGRIYSC